MGFLTSEEFTQLSERYNQIAAETLDHAEARARMQKEIEAEAAHRERAALLTEIARTRILEQLASHRDARGRVDMLEAWTAMHENFGRIGSFIQDAEGRRETIAKKAQSDLRVVMHELARGKIMGDLSRTSRWVGSRKQQARMDNMVRELFGESTDDPTAKAMAEAWKKVSEDLRVRFNAAGGAVQKLEGWGLPQSHDPLALLGDGRTGRKVWIDYMMQDGVLDRDRTVHPLTKERLSDADLRAALEDIWLKITTDGWSNKDVTSQPPGKGALYTQHMDHRFLHFKNADAWLSYAKRFGNPDAFAAMMGHISIMSRDIAHMETFGPNPNALRQYVRQHISKLAAEKLPTDVIITELDDRISALQAEAFGINEPPTGAFERLSKAVKSLTDAALRKDTAGMTAADADARAALGQINANEPETARRVEIGREIAKLMGELQRPITVAEGQKRLQDYTTTRLNRADEMWASMRGVEPGGKYAAEVMQSVRNFISATSLGGAWISSLTDPAFGQDTRMRLGMSFAKANFGRLMVAALKELVTNGSREDAVDAMLGLDSGMNVLRKKAAEVKGVDHRFWTGWIADRTLTWGLLSPWTQAGKHIVGLDIQKFLGTNAGSKFTDLPKGLQTALQTHGFDAAAWDIIRSAPLHEGKALRPNEILDVLDNRELGERYIQMIHRETRYAVPEGTVASRTVFTGAGKPGTLIGEMSRSAGQFKGFGVAVLMLHAGRIAREVGAGNARDALGYGGALIITSTFLGAVAMALKDVRDGRDPRKWLDEKTWLDWKHWGAAFLQAGGLGIYGDLLFSETNRFGGGLESTVAGPLVGRAADILGVTAEINAAFQGKKTNFARYGVNQLRRNVPFANHWLLSLMYQRAVMDRLQMLADPGAAAAFARATAKRKRDYGQSAWWPAGAPTPRRAPDLSRLLATH
jgi:hypothetical protein